MCHSAMDPCVEHLETAGGPLSSAAVTNAHHRFVYNGYLCVQRLDAANDNAADLLVVWDPTEPIATRPLFMLNPGGHAFFCTHDGNKNVSEVFFFQQAYGIAAHYEYAPFGAVTAATRNTSFTSVDARTFNPFRFSSEYADDALGLVYYNYRHYNPQNGRWISRDPVVEGGGVNLFVFLENAVHGRQDFLGKASYTWGVGGLKLPGAWDSSQCCKDLVYISDSGVRDNGFEAKARRKLRGSDGKYHTFREPSSFNPNEQLSEGQCICSLLVVTHGGLPYPNSSDAGPMDVNYFENEHDRDFSNLFVGVKFCEECSIELRACELGRNRLLMRRIADATGCSVKAYVTTVEATGPDFWDMLRGLTPNPEVWEFPEISIAELLDHLFVL